MRWPGAEWGPVRVPRGVSLGHLDRPLALLEAEKAVSKHQPLGPRKPGWMKIKAETELLNGYPDSAIADLTQALQNHSDSVHLQLLLAIAYARRGDLSSDRASFERALQWINKVLQEEPANSVALFDRALIYQRLEMFDESIADFTKVRQSDLDPKWADEAARKLSTLDRGHEEK